MSTQPVTGTFTFLRGTTTDDYGDTADTDTEVAALTSIPGSVIENRREVRRRVDGMDRTVRIHTGRFPGWVDSSMTDDDRVTNDLTGATYMVLNRRAVSNPFGPTYTVCELIKVT